jgi:hypothetical protein
MVEGRSLLPTFIVGGSRHLMSFAGCESLQMLQVCDLVLTMRWHKRYLKDIGFCFLPAAIH